MPHIIATNGSKEKRKDTNNSFVAPRMEYNRERNKDNSECGGKDMEFGECIALQCNQTDSRCECNALRTYSRRGLSADFTFPNSKKLVHVLGARQTHSN